MTFRILLVLAVLVSGACSQSDEPAALPNIPAADAVYMNARIYTVDANDSWASAMAVADGKIVAIGSDADVAGYTGEGTAIHGLSGRMVMPGIHDTHIHPSDGGVQKTLECSFLSYDLNEVLEILKQCLAGIPEGEWLRGGQWNEGLFVGTDKAPKAILDEIAPNHPVFLMDWSVHNAWVNAKALEMFGIDDDTPDPPGGVIVRDLATGEATGVLLDNAAYNNRRFLPAYSLQQRSDALAWSVEQIASHGVTTFKEALVTTANMEAYADLDSKGALPLNVKTNLTWKSAWANSHEEEIALIDSRSNFASDNIDTEFAKIMLDGIPPTYTAALLEPYEPNATFGDEWRGKLMHTPADLAADVTALDAKGLTVKIHATGDRSVRVALDAFEAAREANGDSGLIHEVSHAEIIHADDIPRFAKLNVAAEMCPILWYPIPGLDWELWLGPERSKVWPVKTLTAAGALVIYGSDWPVVPTPNPWPGIESMVTRSDPAGSGDAPDWPEQAVDLQTALRIFTINGAIANKAGDVSGSLEVGKDADFIVLDRNVFEVPITDVGETQVLLSVVAGAKVVDKL
jgi:predicted amidohydrolase YtcJ